MFQKILSWIREVFGKMINTSNVKTAMKVDTVISATMAAELQKWAAMYINQSYWLTGNMKSLNLAASIASELARAVTIEMQMTISGSARAEYLQTQMMPVIDILRLATEYGVAKGGMMLKPYITGDKIAVDIVQADMFYPVAFDSSGRMTACVFADQRTQGNRYYTRLEYHTLIGTQYLIQNRAFSSTTQETLGTEIPLSSVPAWADIEPEAIISNVTAPLFAYFKMPLANNIDPTSPLGVSVYSRAVELIRQADQQWTDFLWEFESGKRALYTDVNAFGRDANGKPLLPDKRLYRLLDLQGNLNQQGLFEDWTPTLREVNIINGLDAILKKIEFSCGLAYGTISDPSTVALTATEIKMGKQRTYATITDTQKALQRALDDLVYAMDVWTTLGNLAPTGQYSVVYWWDDSIVADHDTAFTQDSQAVTMGVMSKIEFRMRNYGEDEATAKKMLAMIEPSNSFFPADTLGI